MISRTLLIVLLFSGFVFSGIAQYGNDLYRSDTYIDPADSSRLFLRFGNATFINNKEFFNPYQPGYTLIGFYLRPALEYHAGRNTRIRAGAHLLKYSGLGRFHQAIPLFSFHHRFYDGLEMVFGSLYGALDHDLIEPLFAFDRVFTHHNESGLQFLVDREVIKADIWINWERFIFTGDPFREEFTAGLSSRIPLIGGQGRLSVELPLQILAIHKGGQIDASGERMQNLVNIAGGVHVDMDLDHRFFKAVGFRGYVAGFRDLLDESVYPWGNGRGIYPNVVINTRWLEAGAGYWAGNRFIAPRGEPLFQSVSAVDPDLAEERREMITSKIIVNRRLLNGIDLGLRFEVYYDIPAGRFDHSGGIHVMVDRRFFITGLQSR